MLLAAVLLGGLGLVLLLGDGAVNWRQIDLGDANLDVLRRFFREHLCATQVECAEALGLSTMAVNRT